MPTWSGDSVEGFHHHLRRWDTDLLKEPGFMEADEGENIGLTPIIPIECDLMTPTPKIGSPGSVAVLKPAGVLKT